MGPRCSTPLTRDAGRAILQPCPLCLLVAGATYRLGRRTGARQEDAPPVPPACGKRAAPGPRRATEREMENAKERKAAQRARVSRRSASRRWCVPPALQHEPDELLEAWQVLQEVPTQVG